MNIDNLRRILHVFLEMQDSENNEVIKELKTYGFNTYDAERLVAFLPIAFCRVALKHRLNINFPREYEVANLGDKFKFNDESVYKAAVELGSHIYNHEQNLAESFNAISLRSSEGHAVCKAVESGVDLSVAQIATPSFFGYKTLGKTQSLLSKFFY